MTPRELKAFMQRHRSATKPWRGMMLQDLADLLTRELRAMGRPESDPPVAVITVSRWRTGERRPEGFHLGALRRVMERLEATAARRSGEMTVAETAVEYKAVPLTGQRLVVLRILGEAQGAGKAILDFAEWYEDSAAARQLVEWGYIELDPKSMRGSLSDTGWQELGGQPRKARKARRAPKARKRATG